jgi:hypothetical protein
MRKNNPNELPDPTNGCEVCATHGTECYECRDERLAALTAPTLHLNGSGIRNLRPQYRDAICAVKEAIAKLPVPHGRDYYVQGDDAFKKARSQFKDQVLKLEEVAAELQAIYRAIEDQATDRRAS